MQKLTQKNINNIIIRYKRGESKVKLAERYGVTRKRIHEIIYEYESTGSIPILRTLGRKKNMLSNELKSVIMGAYFESHLGAKLLEHYIENTRGIHIPHNEIHKILLSKGCANGSLRKKRQRKYCRYQRKHSMVLWHTDWKVFRQNGEVKHLTAYIDNRSRFIVSFGVFSSQTTENSLKILVCGIRIYGCPEQIVTDNGSQYVTLRN